MSEAFDLRIGSHPVLDFEEKKSIPFTFDGTPMTGREGDTISGMGEPPVTAWATRLSGRRRPACQGVGDPPVTESVLPVVYEDSSEAR